MKKSKSAFFYSSSGYDALISGIFALLVLISNVFETISLPTGGAAIILGIISLNIYGKHFRTMLNAKGIMCASWIISVGLSLLRLHPDQTAWSPVSIACISIVLPLFLFGYDTCLHFQIDGQHSREVSKETNNNSTIFVAVLLIWCFLVLLACCIDCAYSREIPILSDSQSSYMDFGAPYVHYLTVSSCLLPALFYCYLKKTGLKARNAKLLSAVVLLCALVPFIIVSRQLMLLELILFIMSIFIYGKYESKITLGKIIALALGALILWELVSSFRNQSVAYLASVFHLPPTISDGEMSLWQIYLYICFNFDNFNYLVNHLQSFSFGALTWFPLLVLTAAKGLVPDDLTSSVGLMALPTFNTYSFMGPAYRDFGILGVAIYSCLIGCFISKIEIKARTDTNPFLHVGYYLNLYSLAITFFVSEFAQPVFWIYLLMLFAANIVFKSLDLRNRRKASPTSQEAKRVVRRC